MHSQLLMGILHASLALYLCSHLERRDGGFQRLAPQQVRSHAFLHVFFEDRLPRHYGYQSDRFSAVQIIFRCGWCQGLDGCVQVDFRGSQAFHVLVRGKPCAQMRFPGAPVPPAHTPARHECVPYGLPRITCFCHVCG